VTERSLSYVVSAPQPSQHLLRVVLTVRGPLPEPLHVAMPVWTPGSYLVREYSRHVEGLRARTEAGPAGVRKIAKDTWAIAHGGASEVVIEYGVYAHELTVRTNHVSDSHAYWNGAATYVRPVEPGVAWDALPIEVTIEPPRADWTIATALEPVGERGPAGAAQRFRAVNYDELVDCPVDMGVHERLEFRVRDKPHAIVLWGARARFDRAKLVQDVTAIVETEAQLFGGLPYDHYLFLLHLAPTGRGGLEHRNSCTLLASPDAFETADGYDDLLSLVAHEFFHLWQIKRIRPEGVFPFDYSRENYTRLLWLFEGGTSYYDWLVLRRAGLVDPRGYLKHLGAEIARLEDTPGRMAQTLEEASFDAWIKLYRPDEHSVNSTVSYYLKGEVVCALLDLEIRARSRGARSLDDVMRHLWREYGARERPVPESAIEAVFAAATDVDVSDAIDAMVRSTTPLPYERVLALAGLALRPRPGRGGALGVRLRADGGRAVVASVLRGGAADAAGIAPGDELIAIDGRRVDEPGLRERLKHRRPGDTVQILYARRDEVATLSVTLAEPAPEAIEIVAIPDASPEARALGEAWLGQGAASLWSPR
jgi:predicted metalloprotease with PDZ domain